MVKTCLNHGHKPWSTKTMVRPCTLGTRVYWLWGSGPAILIFGHMKTHFRSILDPFLCNVMQYYSRTKWKTKKIDFICISQSASSSGRGLNREKLPVDCRRVSSEPVGRWCLRLFPLHSPYLPLPQFRMGLIPMKENRTWKWRKINCSPAKTTEQNLMKF